MWATTPDNSNLGKLLQEECSCPVGEVKFTLPPMHNWDVFLLMCDSQCLFGPKYCTSMISQSKHSPLPTQTLDLQLVWETNRSHELIRVLASSWTCSFPYCAGRMRYSEEFKCGLQATMLHISAFITDLTVRTSVTCICSVW